MLQKEEGQSGRRSWTMRTVSKVGLGPSKLRMRRFPRSGVCVPDDITTSFMSTSMNAQLAAMAKIPILSCHYGLWLAHLQS